MAHIPDGALWEKITKGRAGIRWDTVIDRIPGMEGYTAGGKQEEILSLP